MFLFNIYKCIFVAFFYIYGIKVQNSNKRVVCPSQFVQQCGLRNWPTSWGGPLGRYFHSCICHFSSTGVSVQKGIRRFIERTNTEHLVYSTDCRGETARSEGENET